jgi:hypothetical protein
LALRFNGRIIAPSSLLVSSRACGSRKSSIFPFTAGPVRKFPLRAIQHAVTMSGLGRLGRHLTSEAAAPIQNNLEPHALGTVQRCRLLIGLPKCLIGGSVLPNVVVSVCA